MQYDFRKIFAPAIFPDDEDKTRSAVVLNRIGWSTLIVLLFILGIRVIQGRDVNLLEVNRVLAIVGLAIALTLVFARKGYVKTASVLLVATLWSGLSYITWVADGIRDVAFFGYCIPILLAGLLLLK